MFELKLREHELRTVGVGAVAEGCIKLGLSALLTDGGEADGVVCTLGGSDTDAVEEVAVEVGRANCRDRMLCSALAFALALFSNLPCCPASACTYTCCFVGDILLWLPALR